MHGIIIDGEVKKEHSRRRKQGAKTEWGTWGQVCWQSSGAEQVGRQIRKIHEVGG